MSARVVRTHAVMGTVASVHVHDVADRTVIQSAIEAMWVQLDRLEDLFSTFRDSSEISRINRGELHLLDASPEVIEVVDACTWLEHASDGAFRARRPGDTLLDPAGFVKGWAAELAAQHLDRAGLQHWYLSVGGDIQTRGTSGDGSPWRIAITDPNSNDPRSVRALVEVSGDAVATSGTAARGLHVWDGRTDEPSCELASITVVGPHLTWADAFATAAFVMGVDGLDWVARFEGYRAMAITHDGELISRATEWRSPSERQASMA
ncbi:MAG TPA: FAD:protein FMN transferase [Ilumatobacteraceae bacterium]|nr:FAD:protein FMN transferase [Ilumatobacteraceae bacterium]